MFPVSELGSATECDSGVEKPLFPEPQSLTEPSKKERKFQLGDAFPCRLHSRRGRKRARVIPFLTAGRANLLTASIVDRLGDGGAAGDKRKVPKERFI